MVTKKKEYLGNLYRNGQLFTTADIEVYDHDFLRLTEGILIPHGIYDLGRNVGHINLGLSHDTSEFALPLTYSSIDLNGGQMAC